MDFMINGLAGDTLTSAESPCLSLRSGGIERSAHHLDRGRVGVILYFTLATVLLGLPMPSA